MSNNQNRKFGPPEAPPEATDPPEVDDVTPDGKAEEKPEGTTLTRTVKVDGKSRKQSVTTSKRSTVTQLKSEGWKVQK